MLNDLFQPLMQPMMDNLIQQLGADFTQQQEAQQTLITLGPVAVDTLTAALSHADSRVRWAAVDTMGKIAQRGPTAQRLVRRVAAAALVNLLHDAEFLVRIHAVLALRYIKERRAASALVNVLYDDPVDDVRYNAAGALGPLGDGRVVPHLLVSVRDRNVHIRYASAGSLGELGDTRAVDALLAALHDADETVRYHAAEALGKVGDVRAVDLLVMALEDSDHRVRFKATYALGDIGDTRTVAFLLPLLNSYDENTRAAAIYALARMKQTAAIPQIADLLNDTRLLRYFHIDNMAYDEVHQVAAWALKHINTPQALSALQAWRKRRP